MVTHNNNNNNLYIEQGGHAGNVHDFDKNLDDDGRAKRTGTMISASAHIITAVIGSGVLSLAWAIAQLGWAIGPAVLISFSFITYMTSTMLADAYRSPDPVTGKRNYTYMEVVRANLGGRKVQLCGLAQYVNLVGVSIGYTITASISMVAVKRSNCFHKYGHHVKCSTSNTPFMIIFGCIQILLSQIPNFHELSWLSMVAAIMSFAYSSIGLALSIAKVAGGGLGRTSLTGVTVGVDVTAADKVWRCFQAIGNIAFAYAYSNVLIEIQIMKMSAGNGKRKRTMVGAEDEEGYGLSNKSNVCEQKTMPLYPELFKDDGLSYGGAVKGRAEVMAEHSKARSRPPNMGCRIESFGRICQKFDDRRRRWVCEMGFGSLLRLALDMRLPRQLAYWVMTRMDPISKMLRSPNGLEFRFSKNQVRWVLGIPMGPRTVPSTKTMTQHDRVKVQRFILKYGKSWESKSGRQSGLVYTSVGIPLSSDMMNRLEGYFDAVEEEEFKTLFLIIALEMVLCPTQSPRLASDLLPAISCAMEAIKYDWCSLVLSKLLESVQNFARRFYANGFASGCGGCAIFAVIFYLDRLDRDPIQWDVFPRIKVWTMQQIGKAAKSDKLLSGDYGKLGLLDVAYGEQHPRDARDSVGPLQAASNNMDDLDDLPVSGVNFKARQRRGRMPERTDQ